MFTILKNGEVYAPEYLGCKDVVLVGNKIAAIGDNLSLQLNWANVDIIDATDCYVVPGFIDAHVHITGGGGEGSYRTRTPEINLTDLTTAGVTTVVGVLGTDGVSRTMTTLIAKAHSLEEEGVTCYVHTGSYQVPVRTLTDSIQSDLILVDRIIGVGEIAIADHRSSQPTAQELARLASEARVGGMLSGKSGVVNIHVGDSESQISLIEEVIETTDVPIRQFYPTHMNRNPYLFETAIRYAKKGGYVDFTTSTIPKFLEEGEVKCSVGLRRMLEAGVAIEQITFTSDAQGSIPDFNDDGELIGLKICKVDSLFEEVRDAVIQEGISLSDALKVITENPANILKLKTKGRIAPKMDADIVLLSKNDLCIQSVFAKGVKMVENKMICVSGTFQNI